MNINDAYTVKNTLPHVEQKLGDLKSLGFTSGFVSEQDATHFKLMSLNMPQSKSKTTWGGEVPNISRGMTAALTS